MSNKYQNPYDFRSPVMEHKPFFGREKEILSLRNKIQYESSVVYGEHRIGLSSFLIHFMKLTKKWQEFEGYHSVYVDLRKVEQKTNRSLLLLLVEIALGSIPKSQRTKLLGHHFFDHLVLSLKDTKYLFILDEVDVLTEFASPHSTLGLLRRLESHPQLDICFVLGCSNYLDEIESFPHAPDDSFFSFTFPEIRIGALSDSEALSLIEQPSKVVGHDLSSLNGFIKQLAGTHPMFLQMACYHALEKVRLMSNEKKNSLKVLIEHAFIGDAVPIFETFWKSLSPRQQGFLESIETKNACDLELRYDRELSKVLDSGYILSESGNIIFFSKCFRKFVHNKISISHRENPSSQGANIMIENILTDTVTLIKSNGQRFENIKASVQSTKIFIADNTLPIEEGDKIERKLPSINGGAKLYHLAGG